MQTILNSLYSTFISHYHFSYILLTFTAFYFIHPFFIFSSSLLFFLHFFTLYFFFYLIIFHSSCNG
ncbi:uncharacterized protein BX664DRAFT_329976 [Halteromyces radiatus]|uniref:uncharacterized protein n=1 Tax=Halteromyces radiatus TaxID=101107 RepID=UPI002220D3B8|nr:uncharacterized protein BX664DRAFT_329976 [Halteromyces radiatus]KAI8093560.1 hypothetical protein BX664DRAFT_329976 [Halteromyces radiatus]